MICSPYGHGGLTSGDVEGWLGEVVVVGNVVDAMTVVRSLRRGQEGTLGTRRFRSALVSRHVLDAGSRWEWEPTGDADAYAGLVFPQNDIRLETDGEGTGLSSPEAGWFLHPGRAHGVVAGETGRVVCVWLPWGMLVEIENGVHPPSSVILPTPMSVGLRGFLTALLTQTAAVTPYTDYLVERSLVEMSFGTLVEGVSGKGVGGREVRPIERARSIILVRREDPDFNIAELAVEMHMSTRHLQRLFAEEHSSPADELRRARVEVAKEILGDSSYAALSVEEVAMHSGFGTAAGLRRAFSAFGMPTPGKVRRTA